MLDTALLPHHRDFFRQAQESPFLKSSFPYSLLINVHGQALRIHSMSDFIFKELSLWPEWNLSDGLISNEISIYWMDPELFLGKELKEWGDWVEHHCFRHEEFVFQRDFCAQKFGAREIFLIAKEKVDDGFYNFLRYLLPPLLLKQNQVLFHSSCIVSPSGEAYVFFGHSGAGKTTMAKLCQDQMIIGDDMCLLEIDHGQVWVEAARVGQVYQNPNSFGHRFPVKGLFWLAKGPFVHLEKLSMGKYPKILSSFTGLYWDELSKDELQKTMNLSRQLAELCPTYEFEFPIKEGVWNELRTKLDQQSVSAKYSSTLANP